MLKISILIFITISFSIFLTTSKNVPETDRNKLSACLLLSESYFNSIAGDIFKIIKNESHDDAQKIRKKMLADFMIHCFFVIKTSESDRILEDEKHDNLQLKNWEHLHKFNIDKYTGKNSEINLTYEQEYLVDLIHELNIKIKSNFIYDDYDELDLLKLTLQRIAMKIIYGLIITGILYGIYTCLAKISSKGVEIKSKKRRKSKQKAKSQT